MKFTVCLLFIISFIPSLTQAQHINYFTGDFDSALAEAGKTNKNIFFITRSDSCSLFERFTQNISDDSETIQFLNDEFIVFEFDVDKANDKLKKRLKKYYHSWRGFPQIYFIDSNENLISDIVYSDEDNISHKANLDLWKNYKTIEEDWKTLKHSKRNNLTLNNLRRFLFFREVKYSAFSFFQKINTIKKYFKKIEPKDYSKTENWVLFEDYITHRDYPKLFDFVAQNKKDFQNTVGNERVSKYLMRNYMQMLSWKSKEDREKAINEYPFNTISEAKQAIKNYNPVEPSFKY